MIPWQPTSHDRVQVRPSYGVVPVCAPGLHIVGWEVRVWLGFEPGYLGCNVCGRAVGHRDMLSATASRRPDYSALDPSVRGGYVRVPYAHECSIPVPWAANRRPCEGWEQLHNHPTFNDKIDDVYDQRATPVLYTNPQLAYAAGLALLDIDEPVHMHWIPEVA